MSIPNRGTLLVTLALLVSAGQAEDRRKGAVPGVRAGVRTPGVQIPFASLKSEQDFELGAAGVALTAVGDTVWVATAKDALVPVDGKKNQKGDAITGVKEPCGGLASAFGSLWTASCGDHSLARVDTKGAKVAASIATGTGKAALAVAATEDSIWLLSDDKTTLTRVDPEANRIVAEVRLGSGCTHIVAAEKSLFVSCPKENKVLRIDPMTNLVADRIETAARPGALAFGEGSIWVYCQGEGKIVRIDPKVKKVTATIELALPSSNGDLAFGEGYLWASAPGFPLMRIDAKGEKLMQQFYGEGGGVIRTGAGSLWLAHAGRVSVSKIDPKRVAATLAE